MTSGEDNVTTTPEPGTVGLNSPESGSSSPVPRLGRRRLGLVFATVALGLTGAVVYSGIHSRADRKSVV